jgi:hypothetical protein
MTSPSQKFFGKEIQRLPWFSRGVCTPAYCFLTKIAIAIATRVLTGPPKDIYGKI